MSAAFPDLTPQYASVSPLLAEAVHENLHCFSKLNKVLVDLTQKVAAIHDEAANSLLSTVDVFNKRLNELSKNKFCQNETFVKFIHRALEQMENQAKTLQTLGSSFNDCVVAPLQGVVEKKKEVWKTCFYYVNSFQDQIRKKEDDLIKRQKDYSEAALKVKSSTDYKPKQILFFNNSHNTYILRLSSVNSINNLLYTHVLPHVLHSIECNQGELNDSLRHHLKYMFSVQKDTLKKLMKSVDKIDHATDKIDIVSDLKKFIKLSIKAGLKDRNPPRQEFSLLKSDLQRRASVLVEPVEDVFIVNKLTQPNLQRRLASLQNQTNQIVDSISSMRAGESEEVEGYIRSDDPSLNELIQLLCICDREANLNVLLKQMELYTPDVLDFLGPTPDNIMLESKHTKKSPTHQTTDTQSSDDQKAHEFIESRLMKPILCFYCSKMVIGKGYACKICKMSVHKKCGINVPFCGGTPIKQKQRSKSSIDADTHSLSSMKPERSVVYDLIDLEADDCYDYFDEDEFDDGLSDGEDERLDTPHSPYHSHQHSLIVKPILKPTVVAKPYIPPAKAVKPSPMHKPLPVKPHIPANRRHTMPVFPVDAPQLPQKPVFNDTEFNSKPSIAKKPAIAKRPASLKQSPSTHQKEFCVALYSYKPVQSSDLLLTPGCIVELLDKSNSDWWKGECNKVTGFFPSQYVLETNHNPTILRALYEFSPETEKELFVEEGHILVLLSEEEDWVNVRSVSGEGLVPVTYVEYLSNIK